MTWVTNSLPMAVVRVGTMENTPGSCRSMPEPAIRWVGDARMRILCMPGHAARIRRSAASAVSMEEKLAESVMKKAPFEVKYTESVRFLQIRDKDIVENHSRKIR